ncbi:hypothetical protein J1605_022859 [Eschrichtius robustus]|uniref:Uncharacterized protein n=1 Tax=Eschrichtius robustus TaxID=9764 RepID=A0AB34H7I3_ESCRO|nr:hypothetical protein J1605_022859 [Eschrichtius robustus]
MGSAPSPPRASKPESLRLRERRALGTLETRPQRLRAGFPGGAVVKNLPANAGDAGSSPGPGRSHMPRSNSARVPQLLKPTRLEPVLCNKRSHRNEKPVHRNEE